MNNFNNKFRIKKFPLQTDTENQDQSRRYKQQEQSSIQYQSLSQINSRISPLRKSFPIINSNLSDIKTQQIKKNNKTDNFNKTTPIPNLIKDTSSAIQIKNLQNSQVQQRSPNFPNKTQRKASNQSYNQDRSSGGSERRYQIVITPPKQPEPQTMSNLINVKKQKEPQKKKINQDVVITPKNIVEKPSFTPPKSKRTPQASIYNESVYKIKKIKKQQVNLIISAMGNKRLAYSPIKPRQTLKQQIEKIINQVKKGTKKYMDSLFPGNSSIIFNSRLHNQQQQILFQRARKIYQRYPAKIYKYCDAATIIPGKYTSPNLFSALSILSDNPSRVASIFHAQQMNSQGIYYANLCKDGVWRYIVLDDLLPVRINKKKFLLFAHTTNDNSDYQIWPGLLEKALAKIYGTYQDLVLTKGQGIKNIFRTFTGYPYLQYNLIGSLRSYAIIIQNSLKQNHIVVLQKCKSNQQDRFKQLNLNPQHSYQVGNLRSNSGTITFKNNPEFDSDKYYHLQDIQQMFSRLLIFKVHDNYSYISRTLRHKIGYFSQILLQTAESTQCYFDIWQLNPIYFKRHMGSPIQYAVSPYIIQIKNTSPNSIQNSIFIKQSGQQIMLEGSSIYKIRVHLCFLNFKQYDFTLSYYGEKEVQITRIKVSQKWNQQKCLCNSNEQKNNK